METFVGDTIDINLATGIDLSGYDNLFIKFKKPSGHEGTWSATIDPTDNTRMYYTTTINDLDEIGHWRVQAHIEDAAVPSLHGLFAEFEVLDPFGETSSPPTTAAPTTVP